MKEKIILLLILFACVVMTTIYFLLPTKKANNSNTPTTSRTNIDNSVLNSPTNIGDLKRDGIVFHNMGKRINVNLYNQDSFQNILSPIAKKYQPNGIEIYFYDKADPTSVSPLTQGDFERLNNQLKNFNGQRVAYFKFYDGSFLDNTRVYEGIRTDGVRELHLGLFPVSSGITSGQLSNFAFQSEVILRIIVGDQNRNNKDVIDAQSKLSQRPALKFVFSP